ncbi:MAG: UvrB/UvrC motif-containing protein [Treponema sp.]|jgi:protein arginine kinase activator|nr:UvrB/UvrC motif-containing protein [Treponema sp.]
MKCDICNDRDAEIFMRQVILNTQKEIHLCPECAHERGINVKGDKLEFSLSSFIEALKAKALYFQPALDNRVCPVCGKSLFQIQKDRVAGCPECYAVFAPEIRKLMENAGIMGQYSGSFPDRLGQFRSALTDRMSIRTKLEESVAKEDYEKAALYRDRLRSLERCAAVAGDEM